MSIRAWRAARGPVDSLGTEFGDFYQAEYRPLHALASGLCPSRAEAEEHVHDALAIAYRSWPTVRHLESPGGWTRRVLLNRLATAHRRSRRERDVLVGLPSAYDESARVDEHADVWRAVRGLPARQGQVIALHYLEDRSVDQVAEILGIGSSTVKIHLRRARAALAERLGESGGEQ